MRQYTTPEQTAKLIELGFEMPQGYAEGVKQEMRKVGAFTDAEQVYKE